MILDNSEVAPAREERYFVKFNNMWCKIHLEIPGR